MKIWFAFGDSITDMGYYIDTVCKDLGIRGVKFGYSGFSYGRDPAGFGSLKDAAKEVVHSSLTPDIITLFGGTNDFGHGGTIQDMEDGLRKVLKMFRQKWPSAALLILTPLQRNFDVSLSGCESAGIGPNQIGLYLKDYVQKIRDVAREEKIPVLDLFSDAIVTEENARNYTIDGLHPDPEYGITLGHQIAKAMQTCMDHRDLQ